MKILSLIFGKTIKSITSRIGILLVLGTAWYLYDKYTDATQGFERVKIELSKVSTDNKELMAYNGLLIAKNDSLKYAKSVDSTNFLIREKGYQSIISQQQKKIKELDNTINHFLEIAPCKREVEVKDGNPFKKNKKEWILVDC
jgi:hypothetical protein